MRFPWLFVLSSQQPIEERTLCKEQWGVLHGGLGMLWGRSMRVFDRDALAACDAVEQLSESERCQAAQLATRAGGGRFMNVRDIPAYDSLRACMEESLVPLVSCGEAWPAGGALQLQCCILATSSLGPFSPQVGRAPR